MVIIDGENMVYNDIEKIETCVAKKKIKCLRMKDYNYINVVNEKFLKD